MTLPLSDELIVLCARLANEGRFLPPRRCHHCARQLEELLQSQLRLHRGLLCQLRHQLRHQLWQR